jgi:hypothetical protein
MAKRWARVLLCLVVVGLGITFVVIGLERADQLASVLGAFIGLTGLGLSLYGLLRRPAEREVPGAPAGSVPAIEAATPVVPPSPAPVETGPTPRSQVVHRYGGDHVEIHGNIFNGPVTGKNVRSDPAGGDTDGSA